MPQTIHDLLVDRAALGFVGRERELAALETLFEDHGPLVLHVRGSPGLGKSRLVGAFAARRRQPGHVVVRLDGHAIEPTEVGFVRALAGAPAATSVAVQRLADAGERVVLALDGYEDLRLLDTWLRQLLIPSLPVHVRVLLVSREPPVGTWLAAPEWRGLFQSLTLEPLAEPEASELLAQLGVGAERARGINQFARGHPLALDLRRLRLPQPIGRDRPRPSSRRRSGGSRPLRGGGCRRLCGAQLRSGDDVRLPPRPG